MKYLYVNNMFLKFQSEAPSSNSSGSSSTAKKSPEEITQDNVSVRL